MRFSLFALLVGVAVIALITRLVSAHGAFGLALALPHFLLGVLIVALVRRERIKTAAIVVLAYVTMWGGTAIFGAHHARDFLQAEILAMRQSYHGDPGPPTRIEYDAFLEEFNDSHSLVKPPWYFVGRAEVPCPCVIATYSSWRYGGTAGGGGISYFFWYGSAPQRFRHRWRWIS